MVRTDSSEVASRHIHRGSFEGFARLGQSGSAESTAPIERGASPPGKRLAGLRILVVEDDQDARELVKMVLADAGAVVECASSVEAAIDAFGRFNPELLVSDIGMPDEDGYSLMRRVRARGAEEGGAIPAIAVSAFTRSEDRVEALAAGFSLHLGKPVFPDDLVDAAQKIMASAHDG